ncbi:MAG TPA: sulfite exporter TauE/SafE family protein [Terriglobales bacterium]|nr:sulfite exporter TauE/SafE family protein [Terriglobales bacterium]
MSGGGICFAKDFLQERRRRARKCGKLYVPNSMNIFELTILLAMGSFVAGLLGALTGLGGGVVLVPLLTIFFKVDIRYAIGASLVSVIATSSGAAAAYVKEGFSNIRIGMFLEIATTIGALCGAFLATIISTKALSIIFGLVLVYSAYLSRKPRPPDQRNMPPDRLATRLKMNGSFPSEEGIRHYNVQSVPTGFSLMFGAGALSGLLGIGSGAVKVLAMDQAMKIPFKVSTTTSNFMIGVTAAASAGVYLGRGYIDPGLAMPVMLGVLGGSLLGVRILLKAETKVLRIVFSIVILTLGAQMLYKGVTGNI